MSGFQLLMEPSDVVYVYDGSLAGFYTCVHVCVYDRELPLNIQSEDEAQQSMLLSRRISSDRDKALRVRESVAKKISPRALELCEHIFLTPMDKKELALVQFLQLGFQEGPRVAGFLAHPLVNRLLKAEKHLLNEAHLLSGFIRFADAGGRLVAEIEPKNFVLPLLAPHFADRYSQESFLIFDRTHNVALSYEAGHAELVSMDGGLLPAHTETELYYQALWKQFYRTIAIKERENPRCRRGHMPNRYWDHMVEMQDEPRTIPAPALRQADALG